MIDFFPHITLSSFKVYLCKFSGLFDQIIHSSENVDMVELYKHLHPKVKTECLCV